MNLSGRKLKLLQIYKVFYPDFFGGIPYVMEAVRGVAVDQIDHSVLVCSTNPQVEVGGIYRVRSFGNFLSVPISPTYPLRLFQKLKTVDVALLHSPFPLGEIIFGFGLCRNVRLFVFWHSEVIRQRRVAKLLRPLVESALRRAEAVIVSDQAVLDSSPSLAPFREKVVIAPFPIDLNKYELSHAEQERVRELKSKYGQRIVLGCGRLVPYKGFDVLISAAKSIDARVIIVGEGEQRSRLQTQIYLSGLSDRVKLVGALSDRDLICHMHAAQVFALPSISTAETFGIAQLEAMACGLPIVNSLLPTAVPRVARHKKEALTVSVGNATEFASAIETLLGDAVLAQKMGHNGRLRASKFFNELKFSDIFEKLLFSQSLHA